MKVSASLMSSSSDAIINEALSLLCAHYLTKARSACTGWRVDRDGIHEMRHFATEALKVADLIETRRGGR